MNKKKILSSLVLLMSATMTFAAMSRNMAPVIVKGAQVPAFADLDITHVKVMSFDQSLDAFQPIPFQYDEFDSTGSWVYGLDGKISENDEIVFMAKDAGDQVVGENIWPVDQEAQTNMRYEIAVTDPYTAELGYVYIFYSGTLPVSSTSYINYFYDTVETDVYTLGHDRGIAAGLPTDLSIKGNDIDFLDAWRIRVLFDEIKVDADTPLGRMTVTAKDVFFYENMNDDVAFKNTSAFLTLTVRISTFQNGDPFSKAGPIRVLRANPFGVRFRESLSGTDETANIYIFTAYYPDYSEFHPAFSINLDAVSKLDTDWIAFSKAYDLDAMMMQFYGDGYVNSSGNADSLINESTNNVHKSPISTSEWPGTRWHGFSGQSSSFVNNASMMSIFDLYGDRIAPDRDPNTYFYDHRTVSSSFKQEERTVYGVNGLRIYDWEYPQFTTFNLDARIRTFYFQQNLSHYEMAQQFAAYEQELSVATDSAKYVDTIAPASITDLTVVSETDTSVTLSWTAPGDDGMSTGPAKFYLIRYSTDDPQIVEKWQWWRESSAVPSADVPEPQEPGTTQTLTLYNLGSNSLYFRMRAGDDGDPINYNDLSNIAATLNATVPVELASFTAEIMDEHVHLMWSTASESNNFGFNIQRSANQIDWQTVGFVKGAGTRSQARNYEYQDSPSIGEWFYRLQQIDTDGTTALSDEISVTLAAPKAFSLAQNYPNPFNPSTMIAYTVPEDISGWVTLVIYDLLGRKVVELVNGHVAPGSYRITWNGADDSGRIVGSGVYILRMQAPGFNQTRKMIKLQ